MFSTTIQGNFTTWGNPFFTGPIALVPSQVSRRAWNVTGISLEKSTHDSLQFSHSRLSVFVRKWKPSKLLISRLNSFRSTQPNFPFSKYSNNCWRKEINKAGDAGFPRLISVFSPCGLSPFVFSACWEEFRKMSHTAAQDAKCKNTWHTQSKLFGFNMFSFL